MRTLTKPPPGLVVVKVGGSLFDHPHLGPGLLRYLEPILRTKTPVWLVPGGGDAADAVRKWDRIHRFGDELAHWIALRSMSVTALMLAALTDAEIAGEHLENIVQGLTIVDGYGFMLAYSGPPGEIPRNWDLTSDSVAALAATVGRASRLILLKSTGIPPSTPWEEAAARGWVDAYFPTAVADATFPIEAVNFREWLDDRFPPAVVG